MLISSPPLSKQFDKSRRQRFRYRGAQTAAFKDDEATIVLDYPAVVVASWTHPHKLRKHDCRAADAAAPPPVDLKLHGMRGQLLLVGPSRSCTVSQLLIMVHRRLLCPHGLIETTIATIQQRALLIVPSAIRSIRTTPAQHFIQNCKHHGQKPVMHGSNWHTTSGNIDYA